MKTNQLLQVTICGSTLDIEHKTQIGSLTDLWRIGNAIRSNKGLTKLDMSNYLRSQETLELVQAIERDLGLESKSVDSTDLKNSAGLLSKSITSDLIKTKRGRYNGGTWCHLFILLDAASRLDADFKVMMYKILVNGKLLQWRDDSGDSYKALNVAIDTTVITKTDQSPSISTYITVANHIRNKIKPTGGTWNTATYDELEQRTKIENQLITVLKLDLVTDLKHLLHIIETL